MEEKKFPPKNKIDMGGHKNKEDKNYPKEGDKASKKSAYDRVEAARRCTQARKKRWHNALEGLSIEEVMENLGLVKGEKNICPFCQGKIILEGGKSFRCSECKSKGGNLQLVKKAKGIKDWEAIEYLERLIGLREKREQESEKADVASENGQENSSVEKADVASAKEQAEIITKQEEDFEREEIYTEEELDFLSKQEMPRAEEEGHSEKREPERLPGNVYAESALPEAKEAGSVQGISREGELRELVARVKERFRIEEVIEREAGVKFQKVGANLMCRCPFPDHRDEHPSFSVSPEKQVFHCFGCGRKGDGIGFVMQYRGLRFMEALRILDVSCVVPSCLGVQEGVGKPQDRVLENKALSLRQKDLMKRVRDYFHSRLPESEGGKGFLSQRGLLDAEIIAYFQIGFDDGAIHQAIPSDVIKELEDLGLLNEKKHSRFYQCVTIGLGDQEGNVVSLYGRRINTEKGSKHQFPKGQIQGIFHARALQACKEIILTEGVLDALSVWLMGLRNVSCIFSASSIPRALLDAIGKNKIERVYLALDCDKAGDEACKRFAEAAGRPGLEILRVRLPEGIKDANELLMKLGRQKAGESLRSSLSQAEKIDRAASSTAKAEMKAESKGEDWEITLGERKYRIRGLEKNLSYDVMKVNIRASQQDVYYIDTLDLYSARARALFIKAASEAMQSEAKEIERDLGKVLCKLEEIQEQKISKVLSPGAEKKEVVLTEKEKSQAIELLQSPNLMDRITQDFRKCGMVGEELNSQIAYICATSRLMEDPIPLIIQASSAAGKSTLLEHVLDFMPEEAKLKYTAMTGQSLFYMGEKELVHKILAISEEEGIEEARYAIKIMQSEKKLSIASTTKDGKTGKLRTENYKVDGPAQIMLTTTSEEIDEELQNRCVVITVNENREQTQAIQKMQRESDTLEGILAKEERKRIIKQHQNAQRMLRPMAVVNPYARELTFMDTRLRMRRDHAKYLAIIRAVAFLHQYQRKIKEIEHEGRKIEYVEVKPQDIEIANQLANYMMGTSLDELAPQTRRLLGILMKMVEERCEKEHLERPKCLFTRREVREYTGWGNTQLKVHLDRLADMEYLVGHYGRQGKQFLYELMYKGEGSDGQRFTMGLLQPKNLQEQPNFAG